MTTGAPVVTSLTRGAPLLLSRVLARQERPDRRLLQRPGRPRQTDTTPGWVIAEASEAARSTRPPCSAFGHPGTGCAHRCRRPTAGYSIVWQDTRELAGGLSRQERPASLAPYPFASAAELRRRRTCSRLWRAGAVRGRLRRAAGPSARRRALAHRRDGNRRPGALIFPSINGQPRARSRRCRPDGLWWPPTPTTRARSAPPRRPAAGVFLNAACY